MAQLDRDIERANKGDSSSELLLAYFAEESPEKFNALYRQLMDRMPVARLGQQALRAIPLEVLAELKSVRVFSTRPGILESDLQLSSDAVKSYLAQVDLVLSNLRTLPPNVLQSIDGNLFAIFPKQLPQISHVTVTVQPKDNSLLGVTRVYGSGQEVVARGVANKPLPSIEPQESKKYPFLQDEILIPSDLIRLLNSWDIGKRSRLSRQKDQEIKIDENLFKQIHLPLDSQFKKAIKHDFMIAIEEDSLLPLPDHYKDQDSIADLLTFCEANGLLIIKEQEGVVFAYSTRLGGKDAIGPSVESLAKLADDRTDLRMRRGLYQSFFESQVHFRYYPTLHALLVSGYAGELTSQDTHFPPTYISSLIGSLSEREFDLMCSDQGAKIQATGFQRDMIFSYGETLGEGTSMSPTTYIRPTLRRTEPLAAFRIWMKQGDTVSLSSPLTANADPIPPEYMGYTLGQQNLPLERQTFSVTPATRLEVNILEDDGAMIQWNSIGTETGDPSEVAFADLPDDVRKIMAHNWQLGRSKAQAEAAARTTIIKP